VAALVCVRKPQEFLATNPPFNNYMAASVIAGATTAASSKVGIRELQVRDRKRGEKRWYEKNN
jgi:hypothetical protein